MIFILFSLVVNEVEHIFVFLGYLCIIFHKKLVNTLPIFLLGCFPPIDLEDFLYILHIVHW